MKADAKIPVDVVIAGNEDDSVAVEIELLCQAFEETQGVVELGLASPFRHVAGHDEEIGHQLMTLLESADVGHEAVEESVELASLKAVVDSELEVREMEYGDGTVHIVGSQPDSFGSPNQTSSAIHAGRLSTGRCGRRIPTQTGFLPRVPRMRSSLGPLPNLRRKAAHLLQELLGVFNSPDHFSMTDNIPLPHRPTTAHRPRSGT